MVSTSNRNLNNPANQPTQEADKLDRRNLPHQHRGDFFSGSVGTSAPRDDMRRGGPAVEKLQQTLFPELTDPKSAVFSSPNKAEFSRLFEDASMLRAYMINPDKTVEKLSQRFSGDPAIKEMIERSVPFTNEGGNVVVNENSPFYRAIQAEVQGGTSAVGSGLRRAADDMQTSILPASLWGSAGQETKAFELLREHAKHPDQETVKAATITKRLLKLQDSPQANRDQKAVDRLLANTNVGSSGGASAVPVYSAPATVMPQMTTPPAQPTTPSPVAPAPAVDIGKLTAENAELKTKLSAVEKERDAAKAELNKLKEDFGKLSERLEKLENEAKAAKQAKLPEELLGSFKEVVNSKDGAKLDAFIADTLKNQTNREAFFKNGQEKFNDVFKSLSAPDADAALKVIAQVSSDFQAAMRRGMSVAPEETLNALDKIVAAARVAIAQPVNPPAPAPSPGPAPVTPTPERKPDAPSQPTNASVNINDRAKSIRDAVSWLNEVPKVYQAFQALVGLNPQQIAELDKAFVQRTGSGTFFGGVRAYLASELSNDQMAVVDKLLQGSSAESEKAVEAYRLIDATSYSKLESYLGALSADQRPKVAQEFKRLFGKNIVDAIPLNAISTATRARLASLLERDASKEGPSVPPAPSPSPELSPALDGMVKAISENPDSNEYLINNSAILFAAKEDELALAFRRVGDKARLETFKETLKSSRGSLRAKMGEAVDGKVKAMITALDKVLEE